MPSMVSASASGAVVTVTPANIPNDGTTSAIGIVINDANSDPIAGIGAASIVVTATGTGNTIVQPTGATDAAGTISGASIASTVAEAKTITVTVGGLAMSDTPVVTVTSDAAPEVSAANSTLTRTPGSIAADGTTACTFTLTVRDQFGAAMAGIAAANISLASSRGATDTITKVSSETSATGEFTFTVVSSTEGSPVFTATVSTVEITQTASVTVGTTAHPNEPVGLTAIASFDGTVRGTTDAMDISWLGPWNTDAAAPAGNLAVVADATNPNGSGSALRFVWDQAYNPRCAIAAGTFPSAFSTLYVMARVFYEEDAWDSFGHKFFYIGLPNVAGSADCYLTRELDGRMMFVVQAGGVGLVLSAPGALAALGEWYNIELVLEAESSVGAGDGTATLWVNGVQVDTATGVAYGGDFGSLEWYAQNNTTTSPSAYRLGELYIAGTA